MRKDTFEDTVKNLLKMKPKPHDKAKADEEKEGDGAERRPPASSKKAD